ncbi:MAG: DUF362 domain-containing protein [Gemmatimonadota bacterium]|nr:DUF362 domain-containing protein [Gemmatimonadota bacterium]
MNRKNTIDRRTFLKASSAALVSAPLAPALSFGEEAAVKSRIVRVHSSKATKPWDYNANKPWNHTVEPGEGKGVEKTKERYYDYMNEDVLAKMLDQGLMELTDTGSAVDAWRKLIPNLSEKDTFAFKMNMNNASFDENITTNRMDQTMPLTNAVIDDLVNGLGIPEENITILDASRWFHPKIMIARCKFPKVKWVDHRDKDRWDKSESVAFTTDKPTLDKRKRSGAFWMPRAYTQSDHIINLCLMKRHGCGITGAMKNHYGSIPSPGCLHENMGARSYIPDLCNTPSIRNKVRLNIGEALFANWNNNVWAPRPWITFPEESPNSVFLGTDPVSFDSVMLDHIIEEVEARKLNRMRESLENHSFLDYAMNHHKLGIHEHKPYKRIDYRVIEL